MRAIVTAVGRSREHTFTKPTVANIDLVAGHGVEGDAHQGVTVKHRSRVARDPSAPNLRQVHLIHSELFDDLRAAGFDVRPGELGENVTTRGVDLLGLPTGTLLRLGAEAVVEVTGLRNPCVQIDHFRRGVLERVVGRDEQGAVIRRAGIMSIVLTGGRVLPGDDIIVEPPTGLHRPLQPV
ncbi:MOSC domain-containing protein [Nocardia rhamnosiphila]|uniref:MOSC domain-containing protein n=1 Tax=Nocardia rhamnosiphila TaxID=426716 RepID=A0ABV2WT35_9NOCA